MRRKRLAAFASTDSDNDEEDVNNVITVDNTNNNTSEKSGDVNQQIEKLKTQLDELTKKIKIDNNNNNNVVNKKLSKKDPCPSTFETALAWISSSACNRDNCQQIIGAMNFPATPYKSSVGSLTLQKQWWNKNRSMLLKKYPEKFITAVQQTYRRNQQDEMAIVQAKQDLKDQRQEIHDRYIERYSADRRTMSADEPFVLAVLYPVDKYVAVHGSWFPTISCRERHENESVNNNNKPNEKKRKHDVSKLDAKKKSSDLEAQKQMSAKCKPILCRVMMSVLPSHLNGRPLVTDRHWIPSTEPQIRLIEPITFSYLLPPPVTCPHDQLSRDNILNKHIRDIAGMVTDHRIYSDQVIQLTSPHYIISDNPKKPFEWFSWIKTSVPMPKLAIKKNDNDHMQLKKDLEDYDEDLADYEERTDFKADLITDQWATNSGKTTVGFIKLLTDETSRYRKLLKTFSKYRFVTTVLQIWTLILDFQITTI